MRFKFSQGDKILSIVNSGLSISVLVYTNLLKPEYFSFAVIIAIVLCAITFIVLAIRIVAQSKRIHVQEERIHDLEDSNRTIKSDLEKKGERITQLERIANVPIFKKKWHLYYTFIWRNSISILNNPINLFKIHVIRKLVGTGKTKDNHVTYIFSGECVEKTKSFKFCIAGFDDIALEKIKFHVTDLMLNQELEYCVLRNTQDSNMKYVEIFFRKQMFPGDVFNIDLSWQWPKTAVAKSDYFSIPNIYSITTKCLVLDLYPAPDMKISSVDTYKFGMCDADPVLIEHVYMNEEGFYRSIIENPEKDADYITYYG